MMHAQAEDDRCRLCSEAWPCRGELLKTETILAFSRSIRQGRVNAIIFPAG